MEEVEQKAVDITGNPSFNITVPLTLLNGIMRGPDVNNRTGRDILLTSLQVNGYVSAGSAETITRIIVFYDHQTNGSAPLSSELIDPMRTYGNLPVRESRYEILYDGQYHVNASTETDSLTMVNFIIPLDHSTIFNSGNAGDVTDIITGALYVATIGNNAAGATAPTFIFSSRLRFTEY